MRRGSSFSASWITPVRGRPCCSVLAGLLHELDGPLGLRTICRNEAWVVPAGSPISRARSALPTFTMEALAAAWGSTSQPVTVTHRVLAVPGGTTPVTFQTASRASVSRGMLRPSCCTGSRRRVSAVDAAWAVPARRARRTAAATLAAPGAGVARLERGPLAGLPDAGEEHDDHAQHHA